MRICMSAIFCLGLIPLMNVRNLKWTGGWSTGTDGCISTSEQGHELEKCPG